MNRRTFLAAMAATSLTPIIPEQVFASGGIVSPEHCGFVGQGYTDTPMFPIMGAIDPISIFAIAMFGDGTDRKDGLVTVTTGPTWAEQTPEKILEDIDAFLSSYPSCPAPANRIVLTEDRYTRFLRA